jgi:hypothetical protein
LETVLDHPPLGAKLYFTRTAKMTGFESADITLDEVVSRCHQLIDQFVRALGKIPNIFHSRVFVFSSTSYTDVSVYTKKGPKTADELRQALELPAGLHIRLVPTVRLSNEPTLTFRLDHPTEEAMYNVIPETEFDRHFNNYVVAPFHSRGHLSPLLKCFVLSYFLGMLVRYFPSHWMALIRNEVGDQAFPAAAGGDRFC